jgi:hypothetical protein
MFLSKRMAKRKYMRIYPYPKSMMDLNGYKLSTRPYIEDFNVSFILKKGFYSM